MKIKGLLMMEIPENILVDKFSELPEGTIFSYFRYSDKLIKVSRNLYMHINLEEHPVFDVEESKIDEYVIPYDYIEAERSTNSNLVEMSTIKEGEFFLAPDDPSNIKKYIFSMLCFDDTAKEYKVLNFLHQYYDSFHPKMLVYPLKKQL